MLIGELLQRIQSLYSKGVRSDDSRLSSRLIYNNLLSIRSQLIFQKVNKKQILSPWSYQLIPCVEMIPASKLDCPCLPDIGCTILKSRHPLPKPITGLDFYLISSVTTSDGSIEYSETTWEAKKYKKGNRYTKYKPSYWIRGGHLFVDQKLGPTVLSVSGVFANPEDLDIFKDFCEELTEDTCTSMYDRVFFIDEDLIEPLIQLCVERLLDNFITKGKNDTINNTSEDLENG